MRKLISVTALILGMTVAFSAQAGAGRWGADLRYVAETTTPQSTGTGTLSVCHHVDFADFFFVPVYTNIQVTRTSKATPCRVTDAPATAFAT
jgi:hypothetical protein